MIIHFFRERIKERIDYSELLDNYFCEFTNCNITSDNDAVDIEISEPSFDFSYHFFITKRTRVHSMYKLSPDYVNTNILIEIPAVLPKFLIRKILKVVGDLSKKFDLYVYHEGVKDITNFVMLDLLAFLDKERMDYVETHPNTYYYMDQDTLNQACTYLQIMPEISEEMVVDAMICPYDVLFDKEENKVVLSMVWQVGAPTIFPPLLDYVYVEEEGNLLSVIPANIFFKYTQKLMHEVAKSKNVNYGLDMNLFYLNDKNALKAKKLVRKMRKAVVGTSRFMNLKITDILEK